MNPWIRWNEETGEAAWRWLADAMAMPALLATPARNLSLPPSRLPDNSRESLIAVLGPERVLLEDHERLRHAAASNAADRLRLRLGDFAHAPDAVLYPRDQQDVLALLKLCAEKDIAVAPFGCGTGPGVTPCRGPHAAIVSIDMSAMAHLLSLDMMSGLAVIEAGITGPQLARRLALHGMTAEPIGEASLGGFIAQNAQRPWLKAVSLATPQGLLASAPLPIAAQCQGIFGIITGATISVHSIPAKSQTRCYLFADLAAGLAVLREARRQDLMGHASLSDGTDTRFQQQWRGQSPTLSHWFGEIHRAFRRFDHRAAAMTITFEGSEAGSDAARKRFDHLAKRLGALPLGPYMPEAAVSPDAFLDRGLGVDVVKVEASWSQLPHFYAGLRNALGQAMRAHAPRPGANGLVLGRVNAPRHDGAELCLTYIFPRALGQDVAQAGAIAAAASQALAALGGQSEKLERAVLDAIKRTLDPKAILNPGKL